MAARAFDDDADFRAAAEFALPDIFADDVFVLHAGGQFALQQGAAYPFGFFAACGSCDDDDGFECGHFQTAFYLKFNTGQPFSKASRSSSASGLTATGSSTARKSGKSFFESL